MKEGVDMEKFSGIGEEVMSEWKSVLERMANEQLVEKKGARWRLTARGRQLADTVLENLA